MEVISQTQCRPNTFLFHSATHLHNHSGDEIKALVGRQLQQAEEASGAHQAQNAFLEEELVKVCSLAHSTCLFLMKVVAVACFGLGCLRA